MPVRIIYWITVWVCTNTDTVELKCIKLKDNLSGLTSAISDVTSSPVTPESPWRHRGNTAPWRQRAAAASDGAICICFSYEAQEEGVCHQQPWSLHTDSAFTVDVCCVDLIMSTGFHSAKLYTHKKTKTLECQSATENDFISTNNYQLANVFRWIITLITYFASMAAVIL